MFVHNIDPVLAHIGPLEIRWYGLFYVIIFVYTYFYLLHLSKQKKINLDKSAVESLMIWATVGLIVGGRLFEILFYNLSHYLSNPIQVFAIWNGGLSFHGGLVGVVVAGYLFVRRHKVKFLELGDALVVPLALGQALGRIGNFINGELYGKVTDVFWAVKFPGASGYRHPSQLYEVFYDLIIFAILFSLRNKKIKKGWPHGILLAIFLLIYPVFRFITEFFREESVFIGPLTMGQFLNIFMFLAGIIFTYKITKKQKEK